MASLWTLLVCAFQFPKILLLGIWQFFCFIWRLIKAFATLTSKKLLSFAIEAGEETGILAISLIVNRNLHMFERGFWLVIVITTIFGAFKLSDLQIKRFFNSPTVISVDRDYRDWNGTLPGVTLCYHDHIDSFKANEYILFNWNISIIDDEYFYFMDFLGAVVNATTSNYMDLAKFAEDERFDEIDLFDLVRSINRPFAQIITSFDPDFEVQVISVMTERGLCYAINSPISYILTGGYMDFKEMQQPLTCQYSKHECFIKMDLFESTGIVEVHSPFEVSTTDTSVIGIHKSDEITASYKVMETVAASNLRELTVSQRKCVFNDEETSHLKIYSKSLCLARCRAVMALEMCNCVPFFYPFLDGPSCNPAGFECLLDFKWPIWALHICKCPSTCTDVEYTLQSMKKSSWGIKANDDSIKSDVASSSFRWDLIPPKLRMRRDVVFTLEDLLVSFGGTLALFLGFSLLSIAQLGFVFVFHLFESIWSFLEILGNLIKSFKQKFCTIWRSHGKKNDKNKILSVKPIKEIKKQQLSLTPIKRESSNNENAVEKVAKDDNNEAVTVSLASTNSKPEFEFVN